MTLKIWNDNKMYLAPVASLILWITSVLCFVFGLSFKNPVGYTIGTLDISVWVAFALSIANTIIQLIGNNQDFEKMDGVFKAGWVASYVLGISSNVNALLQILGMGNVLLEWGVAVSLGTMIEVMPEKLIMVWLKSGKQEQKSNNNQNNNNKPKPYNPYRPAMPAQLPRQQKPPMPIKTPFPRAEPTYHPIGQFAPSQDEGEM